MFQMTQQSHRPDRVEENTFIWNNSYCRLSERESASPATGCPSLSLLQQQQRNRAKRFSPISPEDQGVESSAALCHARENLQGEGKKSTLPHIRRRNLLHA